MRTTLTMILAAAGLAGLLSACGAGSGLTTSSVMGSGKSEPQAPKPVTASERALYAAANVARAQRCGFFFDPEQVRANYLAAEQAGGTPPDQMQRVTREFDQTRQAVLASAARDDAYCTEGRTREVKAVLTRQLAGDFNPPQKRPELNVGWFEHQRREQALDGQKVFDASQKRQNQID
jgi:hypothetical protein